MSEIVYAESQYRFTDPIRYFKANDPIYYKVDNIPLTQLMENDLWLKDQIEGAAIKINEIDRTSFSELKPYVDGINSVVKVKPGRYTARINHAYNLEPLQVLNILLGSTYDQTGQITQWQARSILDASLSATMVKFKSTLEADSLGLNGMLGKPFTFISSNKRTGIPFSVTSSPDYSEYPNAIGKAPFPISEVLNWIKTNNNARFALYQMFSPGNMGLNFNSLPVNEIEFIKRWRSVVRTAVVDISSELDIEVPPFNPEDHFYIDENGTRVLLDANQRIDLVFIYSKPVDTARVTVGKYVNDVPTTITTPQLGIVKGAGIGVDFSNPNNNGIFNWTAKPGIDSDGNPITISQVADENNTLLGFIGSGIHGSFPAPDDLMNLTPQLVETLEEDSYLLVGQSVLPVAYVVVRKNGTVNQSGQPVITDSDIIDIRPFFRTTELSYNERAGLAAALPQASIANPVVTEAYVSNELIKVIADYNEKIQGVLTPPTTGTGTVSILNTTPRVVAGGYIRGGGYFGVEGALMNFIKARYSSNLSYENSKAELKSRYGILPEVTIPDYPNWDMAEWCRQGSFTEKGLHQNDYINCRIMTGINSNYSSYKSNALTTKLSSLGPLTNTPIYFIKKTIRLNRSQIAWMRDYHVDVQLWNCVPLSHSTWAPDNNGVVPYTGGASNIWVDKKEDEFTIFVSWTHQVYNSTNPSLAVYPAYQRDNGFGGFMVESNELVSTTNIISGNQSMMDVATGAATYPTVMFKITGYPYDYDGLALDLSTTNPVLTLV